MGQAGQPDTTGGVVVFELERFEWVAPERLEVEGRWFGLRGRRFVRPTLFLHDRDGRRRLLALLDDKPWTADDGEVWTAAFGWEGPPASFDSAELAVASGIDVDLPPPDALAVGRSRRPRRFPHRAVSGGMNRGDSPPEQDPPAVPAVDLPSGLDPRAVIGEPLPELDPSTQLRAEIQWLQQSLAASDARARADAERGTELLRQRDEAAMAAQQAAETARRTLVLELERAREAHQDALRQGRERERSLAADAELVAASLQKGFESDLAAVRAERDEAVRERDKALRQRDKLEGERDKLTAERNDARLERDEAVRARDDAIGARDRALERVGPRATWPDPPRDSLEVWTPRLVGIGLLLTFAATVLLLFARG
jgi:hypothetical protein